VEVEVAGNSFCGVAAPEPVGLRMANLDVSLVKFRLAYWGLHSMSLI
jgi:hypothetical protein